jgi:hypothetical protein
VGPATKPPEKSSGTLAALHTSFLIIPATKNDSCSSYVPDYAKYHSIVEILDNQSLGLTGQGSTETGLPIYRVNTEGRDPVSGEERRLGFAMGNFNPLTDKGEMHSQFGEPGTRITFHGDSSHPFAPAPGISVWDGSIDIDPKCGMLIRANVSKPAGPTVETPEPADKVVLKVGDQQFTKAQMDALIESLPPQTQQAIAAQGKKPLGDQYALIVLLSKQAELHHLDQTPEFAHKLALQKQQMEAQEEMSQRSNVTPEDVQKYYTEHTADFDEIMVRQFVVRKKPAPPKADPAHPTTAPAGPGLSPEDAKARIDSIRKEVTAGTDIKKVMDDFKAPGDVIIDAEPRKVRRGSMRPEMEKVAFALKDGEVSEPVDITQALIFFQVTGHSHQDLKEVTPEIEKKLKQQKVEAALAEVKKNSTIWMDDKYFAGPPKPPEAPTLGAPVVRTPPKP